MSAREQNMIFQPVCPFRASVGEASQNKTKPQILITHKRPAKNKKNKK